MVYCNFQPFRLVALAVKWVFYELFMFLHRMDLWVQGVPCK